MRRSVLAAAGVVVLLGLWLASGLLGEEEAADEGGEAEAEAATPMSVAVTVVSPESMEREIVVHGELNVHRRLEVLAETSGIVERIAIERGERVARGDTLVVLEKGEREAELREARAQVTMTRSEQEAAESLGRQALQSRVQLERSRAALESARAQLVRIERDLAGTRIAAPFDGVINTLPVETGRLVERGDRVAELIDDSRFEVSARVAQQQRAELELGQEVGVEPITGERLVGTLSWISSVADPASRSFAIEVDVRSTDRALAGGVSTTVRIPVEKVEAVFVTPSVLSLGDDGELGVKRVDDEDHVVFVPVTLVRTSLEGAWVEGLEDGDRLITLGQGFVNPGERVSPRPAEEPVPGARTAKAASGARTDP